MFPEFDLSLDALRALQLDASRGGAAPRLRPSGAVSRQVRGGGRASRRPPHRSTTSRAFPSPPRATCATPIRSACSPSRASGACASTPRAARPAGRRWSATRRKDIETWARADGALALRRRRAAGRHHPQCLRLRPVHRRAGRALRRRAARLHGGADVGRLRRAAGPADPRVRRAGRADDAVLHAGDRRRVRAPGRRSARHGDAHRHLRRRALDRGHAGRDRAAARASMPSTSMA